MTPNAPQALSAGTTSSGKPESQIVVEEPSQKFTPKADARKHRFETQPHGYLADKIATFLRALWQLGRNTFQKERTSEAADDTEGSEAAHRLRLINREFFDSCYLSDLSTEEKAPWQELYKFVKEEVRGNQDAWRRAALDEDMNAMVRMLLPMMVNSIGCNVAQSVVAAVAPEAACSGTVDGHQLAMIVLQTLVARLDGVANMLLANWSRISSGLEEIESASGAASTVDLMSQMVNLAASIMGGGSLPPPSPVPPSQAASAPQPPHPQASPAPAPAAAAPTPAASAAPGPVPPATTSPEVPSAPLGPANSRGRTFPEFSPKADARKHKFETQPHGYLADKIATFLRALWQLGRNTFQKERTSEAADDTVVPSRRLRLSSGPNMGSKTCLACTTPP
ncbi:hypothetical protein VOLCADRAFT_103197 [Volvox carteri f. nagariensis]|uniref:Uncharacterized protein n=1 Tax=Volvox carteri f. nagariensis TaxID=3068 RepID=D8TK42_VOLCA|nr:uncharacterized protein VOLCADRAFT_103197 [Volvox carteri f. nagariensis]EFJ51997.1 hypothetical protein VOLCADRAFT_103197 [Volvox carteri f. nagariensis]|eukprot:XP_002946771.1 hypothetical protein VOLCADRAFT_103197 [Volvox carteri f. nagariensis]